MDVWKTKKLLKSEPISEKNKILQELTRTIANKLLGIYAPLHKHEETVDDFLNKDFEDFSLEKLNIGSSIIDILNSRIIEIKNSIITKSALSCVILCGSVLEGILLGIATSKMKEFNQCEISPKNKETQKVLLFN